MLCLSGDCPDECSVFREVIPEVVSLRKLRGRWVRNPSRFKRMCSQQMLWSDCSFSRQRLSIVLSNTQKEDQEHDGLSLPSSKSIRLRLTCWHWLYIGRHWTECTFRMFSLSWITSVWVHTDKQLKSNRQGWSESEQAPSSIHPSTLTLTLTLNIITSLCKQCSHKRSSNSWLSVRSSHRQHPQRK